jgi:hypothetical protein
MSRAVLNDAAMQITCGTDRARFVISLSSDAIYISKWGEIWVAVLSIRSRESEAVTSPSKLKKLVIRQSTSTVSSSSDLSLWFAVRDCCQYARPVPALRVLYESDMTTLFNHCNYLGSSSVYATDLTSSCSRTCTFEIPTKVPLIH